MTATATPSPSPTATFTPTPLPPLIAVDAGHGGIDLGARHFGPDGHMDFHESDVNLDLALRVRDALEARGYRVLLTRDGDYWLNEDEEDLSGDDHVNWVDELQMRLDLINEAEADLLLSIHQNAFYGGAGVQSDRVGGTVTYYCAERPFGEDSLRLAELIQEAIIGALREVGHDPMDRGVQPDIVLDESNKPGKHLILLGPESGRAVRPSQMPGVLSETLFITHYHEAVLARDPEVLDRLAEAYAEAIVAYFEGEPDQAMP
jgi:N-acetylmuramoyl-L-alanine amidase